MIYCRFVMSITSGHRQASACWQQQPMMNTDDERDWLDFEHPVDDEVRDAIKPPSMYKVILVNDDYTPMEFVIDVLQKFFLMMLNVQRN